MNQDQLNSIKVQLALILGAVFFTLGVGIANSVVLNEKSDICDLDRNGQLNLRDLSILAEEIRDK